MADIWRRLSDGREVNVSDYIHDWMEKNPEHKIYIGCDSQNHGNRTIYATVIVMHYGIGGGAHVIYNKKVFPRVKSRLDKLWKEVEFSIAITKELMEYGIKKPDYIDIDLNPDPNYDSNKILRAAVGLIESMGIKARYKTLSPWAISIADSICK